MSSDPNKPRARRLTTIRQAFATLRKVTREPFRRINYPQPCPKEFEDSFGDEINSIDQRRRWRLAGKAADIWNNDLLSIIADILKYNIEQIYGRSSEHPYLGVHCWMIGYNKQRAHPTVVVSSDLEHHAHAVRLLSLICELGNLKGKKFKGRTMNGSPSLCTRGIESDKVDILLPDKDYGLCGSDAFIQSSGRHATICCVLNYDGKDFALTVSHAFKVESLSENVTKHTPNEPRFCCEEWELGDNPGNEYLNVESEKRAPCLVQDSLPSSVETIRQSKTCMKEKGFTSFMIHKSNDPYGCDWALLALEGQTMDLSSYNLNIKTQAMYDGNKEFVLRSVASTAPTGHVCIVTRRGIVKATGSGSSTIINLGSSLRGRVAWTLEVDSHIELGDSGSLVIDLKTGAMYGMLVATSQTLGEAYLIPMADILNDIRAAMLGKLALMPSKLPNTISSPLTKLYEVEKEVLLSSQLTSNTSFPDISLTRANSSSSSALLTSPISPISPVDLSEKDLDGNRAWSRKSILTLDGGGIRGYATLLVMKALMDRISEIENQYFSASPEAYDSSFSPTESDRKSVDGYLPCHYFDYIAGTSTGGLIAIMLSRLRMPVDECLDEYQTMADKAFGKPRFFSMRGPIYWPKRPKYDSRVLDQAILDLVERRQALVRRWCKDFHSPPDMCRTIVATKKHIKHHHPVTRPHLFRSYETGDEISIWQVARATSAAPSYFKSFKIADAKFTDGGFDNHQLDQFARQEILNNEHLLPACIISIGTGTSPNRNFPQISSLRDHLRKTHQRTEPKSVKLPSIQAQQKFTYFRFNVSDGLGDVKFDEWKAPKGGRAGTLETIALATNEYLRQESVQEELEKLAMELVRCRRKRVWSDAQRWDRFAYGDKSNEGSRTSDISCSPTGRSDRQLNSDVEEHRPPSSESKQRLWTSCDCGARRSEEHPPSKKDPGKVWECWSCGWCAPGEFDR